MLPKIHRLQLRFNRIAVESAGTNFSTPLFSVVWKKRTEDMTRPTRFAFVVSKRISKLAVVRNKIRRQFVGVVLPLLPDLSTGFDLIFFARPASAKTSSEEIKKIIDESLKKIGVLSYAKDI